jgi:hypothetical protein
VVPEVPAVGPSPSIVPLTLALMSRPSMNVVSVLFPLMFRLAVPFGAKRSPLSVWLPETLTVSADELVPVA